MMLVKLEISFQTAQKQESVKKEIDKLLDISEFTMKYNLEFKDVS